MGYLDQPLARDWVDIDDYDPADGTLTLVVESTGHALLDAPDSITVGRRRPSCPA